MESKTICFLILPGFHLLDLSGSAQAFYEANALGNIDYKIVYASDTESVLSEQGLVISSLKNPNDLELSDKDYVIIPGTDSASVINGKLNEEIKKITPWLIIQSQKGVNISTICTGALILAHAGLLDGKKSTTHWKCIDYLIKNFPEVKVQTDCLFVSDDKIHTSAGMTSGIDMSLSIIEQHQGPIVSSKVAREMVVYMRRQGSSAQHSIYLDYHTHLNPIVHKVQNYIISNPTQNPTIKKLAEITNTSTRNLTRTFKEATGTTITEFKQNIKLDLALHLVNNPNFTVEQISEMCGFQAPRQLQRLWKAKYGNPITKSRQLKLA